MTIKNEGTTYVCLTRSVETTLLVTLKVMCIGDVNWLPEASQVTVVFRKMCVCAVHMYLWTGIIQVFKTLLPESYSICKESFTQEKKLMNFLSIAP